MEMATADHLDQRVRAFIYDALMASGKAPTIQVSAMILDEDPGAVRASFQRLADGHVFILQSDGEVMAANPFANIQTTFVVESGEGTYSAMCVWDALGIPVMLNTDAIVRTACGDCNDAMELRVRDGMLEDVAAMIHFGVPARHWWDNIVFS